MTGQEVPRDGLPASQVARPASLGISEVLSSRWVSNTASDQGWEQVLGRVQVYCDPELQRRVHPHSAVLTRGAYAGA